MFFFYARILLLLLLLLWFIDKKASNERPIARAKRRVSTKKGQNELETEDAIEGSTIFKTGGKSLFSIDDSEGVFIFYFIF